MYDDSQCTPSVSFTDHLLVPQLFNAAIYNSLHNGKKERAFVNNINVISGCSFRCSYWNIYEWNGSNDEKEQILMSMLISFVTEIESLSLM